MAHKFTTRVRGVTAPNSDIKEYHVSFTIDAQTFTIFRGKNENIAKWYEQMLIFALNKLTDDTETGESRSEREEGGENPK
jgi:hypothetical protein